jgi:hypothetical protein
MDDYQMNFPYSLSLPNVQKKITFNKSKKRIIRVFFMFMNIQYEKQSNLFVSGKIKYFPFLLLM